MFTHSFRHYKCFLYSIYRIFIISLSTIMEAYHYNRRMVILAGVGILHYLVNPGDALLVYAIIGMPVLFLDKIPKKINLILGIAWTIIGSYVGNKILITLPLMIL